MQTATRTTYQQQQQQQPMKEHTRQTKKQKLEQRITPDVAKQYLLIKGQEGLPSKGSLHINLKVPVRKPGESH
jgi:hypothetical protein